jgi:hypothetical protein
MYSGDRDFLARDFHAGGSSRDAIDGFSAIAVALDRGFDESTINGGKIADVVAILLGWALLAAVILYPALQLAAIAACVVFVCMRSFVLYVFGQASTLVERSPGMLQRHNHSLGRS